MEQNLVEALALELNTSAFKGVGDLRAYVQRCLVPTWTSQLDKAKYLINYRDVTEAILEDLGVAREFTAGLKAAADKKAYCLQVLEDSVLASNYTHWKFLAFRLQCVADSVLKHARSVNGVYPVLIVSRDIVESVCERMLSGIDLQRVHAWASELKSTVWTVLGLYASVQNGDAEDLFIHPPLPKVFGAPCQARDVPKETTNPKNLTKASKYETISVDRAVMAGHGRICYKPSGSDFKVFDLESAELVAVLPGTAGIVWCANPSTRAAVIVALEAKGPRPILCFELPDANINWIDCQRDAEGLLVLLWGHVDTLTGSGPQINWAAIEEDSLLKSNSGALEFRDSIVDLPDRRHKGCRVDYRDHGNLLSVVRTTKDAIDDKEKRTYEHTFNIMFGNHLIWTYESRQRPIEAVFGSPSQMLLLSPYSSAPLQLWALKDGNDRMWYQSVATSKLPADFVPKSVAAF